MAKQTGSTARQMPLFEVPAKEEEITRETTLQHVMPLFQRHLFRDGKTANTVNAFTADMHLLGERLGAATAVGDITTSTLQDFMDWLENGRGVPCSRKSYARRVTTLKVFFRWLTEAGVLEHDPAVAILQRSGPAPLATILDEGDVINVLAYCSSLRLNEKSDPRPEFLFRLLLETGIKKNETMRLRRDDFDLSDPKNPMLRVRQESAANALKERRLRVSPSLIPLMDAYLKIYPSRTGVLFTCTPRNLEYVLADIADKSDLPHKISFEMMRWTAAVRDYQTGMEPDAIREKLGLSKISWTETFQKIRRLAGELAEEEAI
jgi:integrase/recombinase XerD